ncbi:MAG: LysR family transcriptional regulator [Anaeromyxobacter sp.]
MAAPLDTLVSMALFVRVVEDRSFTAAARSLGISKSAVSARVARLEDQLGVRLLERTTRKVAATAAGQEVYERAARMVAAAEEAAQAVEGADAAPRGTVRITAPVTFTNLYLAAPIAGFVARHPHVRVELITSDRLVDLVEDGFDLAIRISRLADSSLVARKLASDRLVVVAAPAYLARAGAPRTPADLVQHECLRSAHIPASGEWGFRGLGTGQRVGGGGRFVASDAAVLRSAAVAGLGLAVLPLAMVAHELAAGRLTTVLEGHARRELGIYAVHTHRRHVPPKVRALIDHLAASFAKPPWLALVPRGARAGKAAALDPTA